MSSNMQNKEKRSFTCLLTIDECLQRRFCAFVSEQESSV